MTAPLDAARAAAVAARAPEARAARVAALLEGLDPERRRRVEAQLAHVPESMRPAYLRAAVGKASPREVVKLRCLDCACWQRKEVILCTALGCPSWPSRPWRERVVEVAEAEVAALEAEGLSRSAEVLRRTFLGAASSGNGLAKTPVAGGEPAAVDPEAVPGPAGGVLQAGSS